MKSLALLMVFAFSSMVLAQDKPAAPQGPVATPLPAAPPPAVAVKPMAPKPMTASRKARRQEDARHCLEKATNDEVIKCAEEYL